MLRVTQDVVEIRRWAEARGARPCRDTTSGRIGLALPGEPCEHVWEVGWDEFEPTFMVCREVFVYEDAPGATLCYVGDAEGARRFLAGLRAPPGAYPFHP